VDVQDWWSGGELVPLELSGTEQGVFVRREGSGPSMTLLHGFPSSSHDWAKIAPALAERYALTMPDLLGFGASSKPREHRYSLIEQADLVEALWGREGIESTVLVAHDYSVSVAQELLTRRAAGALAVDLRALHFMNGGLYPDLHRPQPAQVALLDPEHGAQISAAMNGELFMAGLAPTFPEGYDSAADAAGIWQSFHLHNGQENTHLLIRYIEDRRENAERWTQVLETTDVPLTFVLGDARPGLRRAHGRAHPRATPRRTVHGAGGRCALAAARGTGARGRHATGPAAVEIAITPLCEETTARQPRSALS
jgi:pimeloyl-ACP methyl ester carboxylesterase